MIKIFLTIAGQANDQVRGVSSFSSLRNRPLCKAAVSCSRIFGTVDQAASLKIQIFMERNALRPRRFGGMYCCHFQGHTL